MYFVVFFVVIFVVVFLLVELDEVSAFGGAFVVVVLLLVVLVLSELRLFWLRLLLFLLRFPLCVASIYWNTQQ